MPVTNKTKKKTSSAVIITLVVLAIVASIGIVGIFLSRSAGTRQAASIPENFVSYPTVSSSVASSNDGKSHTIDIDLVVEYGNGAEGTISHDAVYEKMEEIISSLDYERLKQSDSIEHIEDVVKQSLSGVAGDNVAQVYVGNIAIDFPGEVDNSSDQQASGSREKLKGLFKNLQ